MIITTLTKKFITFSTFWISLFIFLIFIYPIFFSKDSLTFEISAITSLPSLAFSHSIFENRIKEYKEPSKKILSQNVQINYMDFVYEK